MFEGRCWYSAEFAARQLVLEPLLAVLRVETRREREWFCLQFTGTTVTMDKG